MRRVLLIIVGLSILLSLSACGGGKKSVDYETIVQKFADVLFAGKFDEAKKTLTEQNAETVGAQIDSFAILYGKYKFQEVTLASTRAGKSTSADAESDKRAQYTFQFSPKDSEDWAYGSLEIRAVLTEGMWVITELKPVRPVR